jgi:hypothetical protein
MNYNDLLKIKILKNQKIPAEKWKSQNKIYKSVDLTQNNVGILTGSENDLLVLDIDTKDNGLSEFTKYFNINDMKTVIVKTVNNGYHLYYKYSHSNPIY